MLDRLEAAVAAARGYTELRQHANTATRVVLRQGSIIANTVERFAGVSARCHDSGGFGFAAEPEESDDAIARVMAEAHGNSDLAARLSAHSNRALPVTEPGRGVWEHRSAHAPLPPQARVDLLRRLDAGLRARHPDLANVDLVLQELAIDKALATTEGALAFTHSPRTVLYAALEYRGSDGTPTRIADVFGGFGGFEDHDEALGSAATEAALDRLYDELRRKAEGVFCDAGMHDVVLDADIAGILAHEAIGHTCEGDLVLGGSVAGPALGQRVASEKITLMDQAGLGMDGGAAVAVHVDDEGTPCRDVTIIDHGVLRGFLHNKDTALELGMAPTGNARAHAYSDEPLVRMRNTCILPGDDRLEDMIGAIDRGYYFTRSGNGQADFTGEFMFAVASGYEIRGGKLGRAIRDTTISGIAFDMLKAVTHVGDRFVWSPGGWCGKKQLIPVTMGGAAIKTRINVGGR